MHTANITFAGPPVKGSILTNKAIVKPLIFASSNNIFIRSLEPPKYANNFFPQQYLYNGKDIAIPTNDTVQARKKPPTKPYNKPAPKHKNINPGNGKHAHSNIAPVSEMKVICEPLVLDQAINCFNIIEIRGKIRINTNITVNTVTHRNMFCLLNILVVCGNATFAFKITNIQYNIRMRCTIEQCQASTTTRLDDCHYSG